MRELKSEGSQLRKDSNIMRFFPIFGEKKKVTTTTELLFLF